MQKCRFMQNAFKNAKNECYGKTDNIFVINASWLLRNKCLNFRYPTCVLHKSAISVFYSYTENPYTESTKSAL